MGEAPFLRAPMVGFLMHTAYPAWMAMIWGSNLTIQHGSAWPTRAYPSGIKSGNRKSRAIV